MDGEDAEARVRLRVAQAIHKLLNHRGSRCDDMTGPARNAHGDPSIPSLK